MVTQSTTRLDYHKIFVRLKSALINHTHLLSIAVDNLVDLSAKIHEKVLVGRA